MSEMGTAFDLVRELADGLPESAVVTEPAKTEQYSRDQARFCPVGEPVAVVRAGSTADVAHTLTVASRYRVPVVPQGAHTGLSGAANAVDGCIVLSVRSMDRILEINEEDQVAVVEPGILNVELSRAVAERGLFYPPDPGSWEISSIGGNVATNAGGMCCVKYGVTGDFVRGLEVVLADGTVIDTGRRTAKGVAGLDLTSLIVGSEGTLGVVTKVTLGLKPAPAPSRTMAATFPDARAGLAAVTAIMASGVSPSLMEFLDAAAVGAVNAYSKMGFEDGCALILAQSDGTDAVGDVVRMGRIARDFGAVDVAEAADDEESALLLEARRKLLPALEALGGIFTDDVAVPRSRMVEFLDGMVAIGEQHDVQVICAGHAGDGNVHPTVVFERGDDAAEARARLAFSDIMRLGLRLGGTITGEHGVGLLKAAELREELPERSLELQRRIKQLFDPLGIMNPGKMLS
ncbi:FAD-binding oxidoreductase [Spelaeicoccus albus]|uniref:Glycolate oxidase n=1 Tax=Spelaeicoccus albus TaxID=1280376 RepID=A0A7Z0D2A5_9MICO|nr:FAD-linked oxidase C-terminal domain-containing protein [Spelaeicoccus albus]NYI67547.1 glycolate oxidase [Spelaeicoccus albus]